VAALPNIAIALPVSADTGAASRAASKATGSDDLFAAFLDDAQQQQQSMPAAIQQPAPVASAIVSDPAQTTTTTIDQALLAQLNTVLGNGAGKGKTQTSLGTDDPQTPARTKNTAIPTSMPAAVAWQGFLQTLSAAQSKATDSDQDVTAGINATGAATPGTQPFMLAALTLPKVSQSAANQDLASSLRSTTAISALSTARFAIPPVSSANTAETDTPSSFVTTQAFVHGDQTSTPDKSAAPNMQTLRAAQQQQALTTAPPAAQPRQISAAPRDTSALQSALASLGADQPADLTTRDIAAALSNAQTRQQAQLPTAASAAKTPVAATGTGQPISSAAQPSKTVAATPFSPPSAATTARAPQTGMPAPAQAANIAATSPSEKRASVATPSNAAAVATETSRSISSDVAQPAKTTLSFGTPAAAAQARAPQTPITTQRASGAAAARSSMTVQVSVSPDVAETDKAAPPVSRAASAPSWPSFQQPEAEDEPSIAAQTNAASPPPADAEADQPANPVARNVYTPSSLFAAQQLSAESDVFTTLQASPTVLPDRPAAPVGQSTRVAPAAVKQTAAQTALVMPSTGKQTAQPGQPAPSTTDDTAAQVLDQDAIPAQQPSAQPVSQQSSTTTDHATSDAPASSAAQQAVQTTALSPQLTTPSSVQIATQVPQPVTLAAAVTAPVTAKAQPQTAKSATVPAAKAATTANPDDPAKTLSDAVSTARQAAPASATVAKAAPQQNGTDGSTAAKDGSQPAAQHDAQAQTNTQTATDSASSDTLPQAAVVAQPDVTQPTHVQTGAPVNAAVATVAATTPVQTAQPNAQAIPLQTATHADAAAQPNLASLALNIAVKSKAGQKQFDIRLDPPELGRVDVKLSIDDGGKVQANLSAEKPHTLELLQRDRGTLERSLRDAGLDLTGGGLNFSLKGQNQQSGDGAQLRGRAFSAATAVQTDLNTPIVGTRLSPADGRLDIRV
jgi:flagellar hook-length control protein FliK